MSPIRVAITPTLEVGDDRPLLVIAGPCVAESLPLCLEVGRAAQQACAALGLSYIFKASFDKANRTSGKSYRGPGLEAGLEILAAVKRELGVPILTDIHECWQVAPVAQVADVLQIPAFLCRQTDLLLEAAASGRTVNVKKGQFLAPGDMQQVVDKVRGAGNDKLLLTERGTSFGYHNLVVDMRGLAIMRELGVPVVFDATHAVQLPGGQGATSGGQRQFVPVLMRAALAVGVDGVFLETHPRPADALSDGPNSVPLADLAGLLQLGKRLHDVVRSRTGH